MEELLYELEPEELEPRLELQVLIDPLAGLSPEHNNNCQVAGSCVINLD